MTAYCQTLNRSLTCDLLLSCLLTVNHAHAARRDRNGNRYSHVRNVCADQRLHKNRLDRDTQTLVSLVMSDTPCLTYKILYAMVTMLLSQLSAQRIVGKYAIPPVCHIRELLHQKGSLVGMETTPGSVDFYTGRFDSHHKSTPRNLAITLDFVIPQVLST